MRAEILLGYDRRPTLKPPNRRTERSGKFPKSDIIGAEAYTIHHGHLSVYPWQRL